MAQGCGVLILIVVEDGLVLTIVDNEWNEVDWVLILIVVEDGLVRIETTYVAKAVEGS